jgi:hypothetical protein
MLRGAFTLFIKLSTYLSKKYYEKNIILCIIACESPAVRRGGYAPNTLMLGREK